MNTPKDFSKEVNKITFDFIWNDKPDKALKLSWVKRLCSNSDAPWQYIPKSLLIDVGGTELFKCYYDYNLLDLDNHLPAFYKQIIFY